MTTPTTPTTKFTIRLPLDLAQQFDAERARLSAELGTRFSMNQFLERTLRRGLKQA